MSNSFVRHSSKVGIVLTMTLVFGLLGALPAFATATSTALVNVHNVLAGQAGKIFSITVNNTESAGIAGGIGASTKTIKEVRIMPPPDLIDAVLPGSSGPGQFTDIRVVGEPPAEIRFRVPGAAPGLNPQPAGGLAPASNATFTVAADVRNTLLQDGWENWRIRVTSDMVNYTASTGTGENLRTDIRVLQVQNVAVVAPTGAADDRDGDGKPEVTGTQGNICVRTRVRNAAATGLPVTPGLSGGSINVGPARTAATPPCSGATLSGGSQSIAANGFSDFDFLVSAADVGSSTGSELVGTASAPGASTPATGDPDDDVFQAKQALQIEPKSVFSYVAQSLNPRAVVPDLDTALEENFSIRVNKGPAGSPPLPTLSGQFQSAFCDTQPGIPGIQFPQMTAPISLGGGAANNQTVSYEPCDIAAITDGRYSVTSVIGYTDGNGLVQAATSVGTLEQVRLDSLIPSVDLNAIVAPPVQVTAVPPVEPAVKSGQAFSASGSVKDTDPATGQQVNCGPNPAGSTAPLPCTLETAELIQYPLTAQQGGGNPLLLPRIPVKPSCTLSSSGSLSCSLNVTFTPGTGSDGTSRVQATALAVSVKDETGNIGSDVSPLIDVDIIAPFIQSATTRRGGTVMVGDQQLPGQRRTIVVQMNEPVETNQGSTQDWIVQDGSAKTVCNVSQSPDKRTVTLTTCTELDADSTGTVDYNPRAPISQPYHDRVGTTIPGPFPVTEDLTDGIEPLTPAFLEVEDKVLQDDAPSTPKFFFNTTTPKVELIENSPPASAEDHAIRNGYIVEVYEETDGTAGLNRLTDRQICGEGATGAPPEQVPNSATLTNCDFSGVDRTSKVYGLSIDGNANPSLPVSTDFVLDRVRPVFDGLSTLAGTEITVNFLEPLCQLAGHGTETAANWKFDTRRISDNQRVVLEVTGDADGTTAKQRKLTFSYQEHSAATVRAEAVKYRHDAGDRYQDRAGNELLDGDQLF